MFTVFVFKLPFDWQRAKSVHKIRLSIKTTFHFIIHNLTWFNFLFFTFKSIIVIRFTEFVFNVWICAVAKITVKYIHIYLYFSTFFIPVWTQGYYISSFRTQQFWFKAVFLAFPTLCDLPAFWLWIVNCRSLCCW